MEKVYYFLKEDLINIEKKILEVLDMVKEDGKKIGESCDGGADTWHDNFDYEEGIRQISMHSGHLKQFTEIRRNARVITPNKSNEKVSIGKTVKYLLDGVENVCIIASYMVLASEEQSDSSKGNEIMRLSYNTPLAQLLIHHKVNDTYAGVLGEKNVEVKIISIS